MGPPQPSSIPNVPRQWRTPIVPENVIRRLIDCLGLPEPKSIFVPPGSLASTPQYHTTYKINLPRGSMKSFSSSKPPNSDGSHTLTLKVYNKTIPGTKTMNEVSIMAWLVKCTLIPVPSVVSFGDDNTNPLGCEYILMDTGPGVPAEYLYNSLDESKKAHISHCGGLSMNASGRFVPGPLVEEGFWYEPEIIHYWRGSKSVASANSSGPFKTYTDFLKDYILKCVENIRGHESLKWMEDLTPRLEAFATRLEANPEVLNNTRYVLTHRNLSLGNVICNSETGKINAITGWDFSAVLPLPMWSTGSNFLWNGQDTPESRAEQERLIDMFEQLCADRDPSKCLLNNSSDEHPHCLFKFILSHLHGIIEVCPKNQMMADAKIWRQALEYADW
ncbi:kinase-like domain-containing protein [Hypoxylon trugodes]|uniref:kinase-like domain-containing protein n=1 Tax=Hypoxylon trugodes TaxID=326681 RepID=UPI00219CAB29|nr:kinase-like domain-containing protein [Hypoxylon trugodes]KAI1384840.1 kinase-like domain-containing protein [Hypoxylon trugodes]